MEDTLKKVISHNFECMTEDECVAVFKKLKEDAQATGNLFVKALLED